MALKHTPGPLEARKGDTFNPSRLWGVVKLLPREACIEVDGDDSGYGGRTEVIAEVTGDDEQAKADAVLFASAPDLLKELAACVESLRIASLRVTNGEDQNWFDTSAARAAIAKATSE